MREGVFERGPKIVSLISRFFLSNGLLKMFEDLPQKLYITQVNLYFSKSEIKNNLLS